ncbi:MAG: hypothetical protein M4579_006765 [Chaenotheca gracillima]|nr:MAG: hypothetical protein M4579_006765 [Chaenotheca gracillima]
MVSSSSPSVSWSSCVLLLLGFFALLQPSLQTSWIESQDDDGNAVWLADTRQPALYTRNFGDCLSGNSIVNVSRFDAAYYRDNMTVLFHLQGSTNVHNESLMMHIGVYAYGEARFDLTFNPCNANIESLCPMKAGVPIEANGIIPIAPSDVAGIPPIALVIPDFEGQATLRIFANSTQSEIGCYSAVVTNGITMAQPTSVGTVLGVFTLVAMLASFATAIYGDHIPTIRKHYAHSVSIFVVFAVWHHIFFSGALSLNWPSVLAAFWSNYAWTGGMIYSNKMQDSISRFVGSGVGNSSVGGNVAGSAAASSEGGSFSIQSIYKRTVESSTRWGARHLHANDYLRTRALEHTVSRRSLANTTSGYSWYGEATRPGLPLPGNFSSFGGTLSAEGIPTSNAFMTGFLWLIILIVILTAAIVAFKWTLEALSRVNMIKKGRLTLFRTHWISYTVALVLRICFIAFFMMMFLTMFQFSDKGPGGVTAVAALVFLIFFVGMLSIVAYACFYRLRLGRYQSEPDRLHFERKPFKKVPWFGVMRDSQLDEKSQEKIFVGSLPWWRVHYVDHEPNRISVHDDEDYTRQFGWLSARFRRTRWWFFAAWVFYEFLRACFYGGAAGHPMTQIVGLLIIEIVAFVAMVILKPFEATRLNVIMVYMLGASKIATLALSATFDVRYNLGRIITTAIGIIIIVIQGILTIVLLIAIAVGAIATFISITRDREEFKPRHWTPMREKYLQHVDKAATDLPPTPPQPIPEGPTRPSQPYFNVSSVRRCPKIEDEDEEFMAGIDADPTSSRTSIPRNIGRSRASSIGASSVLSHNTVPWGARVHRASWSTKEFENHIGAIPGGGPSSSKTSSVVLGVSGSQQSMTPLVNEAAQTKGSSPLASKKNSTIEERER